MSDRAAAEVPAWVPTFRFMESLSRFSVAITRLARLRNRFMFLALPRPTDRWNGAVTASRGHDICRLLTTGEKDV
jgi:hypothetical protein